MLGPPFPILRCLHPIALVYRIFVSSHLSIGVAMERRNQKASTGRNVTWIQLDCDTSECKKSARRVQPFGIFYRFVYRIDRIM